MQQRKLDKSKEENYAIKAHYSDNRTKFEHTTEHFICKVLLNMRKLNIYNLSTIVHF